MWNWVELYETYRLEQRYTPQLRRPARRGALVAAAGVAGALAVLFGWGWVAP